MKFPVTKRLKAYAAEKLGVPAAASDRDVKKAVGLALLKGTLTTKALRKLVAKSPKPTPAAVGKTVKQADIDRMVRQALKTHKLKKKASSKITPAAVFSKSSQIRVKEAADAYSQTKTAAIYPTKSGFKQDGTPHLLAGQPAYYGNRPLDMPSELDKAISGAYVKWMVSRQLGNATPRHLRMDDHSRELILYALHKCRWSGMLDGSDSDSGAQGIKRANLSELQIKGLLDDTVSGGIEIAPTVFDDAIILLPVLYGELFPFVNVKPITRGRRVKGGALSLPEFTDGVSEGSAITPFDTSGYIEAFDTGIYNAALAMTIGLDFEEDTPVDIGNTVTEQCGLQAMAWLDKMIAVGNGTTQPTGIFNATGTTSVNSDNGPGGPPTISDYEALMFGVQKKYRNEPGAMPVFIGSDTSYRRARGIQVGPGDQRRIMGMDHGSYMALERPFKVQNDIPNNKIAYVNLRRYRMYRRLGMNVRVEMGGQTLALTNQRLLLVRMRWGGQLETGGAAAVMTDAWA